MEVKIIECPRDAIQGLSNIIPTEKKLHYLKALAKVGFHTLDYGSFVSSKSIPQMADTGYITEALAGIETKSKLLAIVGNSRGATNAVKHENVSIIGFPYSVSETFQIRNTNARLDETIKRVTEIQSICNSAKKELVIYLSMAFGNPYGDEWNKDIVIEAVNKLVSIGINTISLSDTIGIGNPDSIFTIFKSCHQSFPELEWGMHLHAKPSGWKENIAAGWEAGCRRFDGALKGFGGCPMASDQLTGNIATENIIQFLREKDSAPNLNYEALQSAMDVADELFTEYANH